MLALAYELAADVDVTGMHPHRAARDQTSFDEQMRIVPHDLAVLAGAGFGLVSVDDEIARTTLGLFWHERPFDAGRESGTATPALAGCFHLVDDSVAAFFQDCLGAVPSAARAGAGQPPIVAAVEIFEDAVFISEHCSLSAS